MTDTDGAETRHTKSERNGDRSPPWLRLGLFSLLPFAVAVAVGLATGAPSSGLVVGAGVGFGLALSVFVWDRLSR